MTNPLSNAVASLAPSIIRQMSGRRRPTSVDLSLGQPALPPDEAVIDRALAKTKQTGWGYTPNAGITELRAAIASHYGLEGRGEADNVIVTVGSEEAVYLALLSAVNPGDEVLFPEPGYPAYRGICRLLGATPVPYPLRREDGFAASADAIAPLVTSRSKVIVLNSPSNPFGCFESEAELRKIAALVESNDMVVLADEIYRDLVYDDSFVSITTMTERSILVSGLSKSCALTGFRLGYLVADAAFVKQATLAHQLVVTCAPRLSQYAALEVFERPELLTAHVPYYAEARAAVVEAGANIPLFVGKGAFYAIVDVSERAVGDPFGLAVELFEAEDVIVVPGTAFGADANWFWRLSYAAGAETATEGVRRIARFLGA